MFDHLDDPEGTDPPPGMVEAVMATAARRVLVRRAFVSGAALVMLTLAFMAGRASTGDSRSQRLASGSTVPPALDAHGQPLVTVPPLAAETTTTTLGLTGGATTTVKKSASPSVPPTTAAKRATTTTTTAAADPACSAPEGGEDQPTTKDEFESRISHAWKLCTAPSAFGTDEAGLELRADHRWSKLARSADGRFIRMQGWGNEGTWDAADTSQVNGPGQWQLNLNIDGGGSRSPAPLFAKDVPKLRLMDYINGTHADYLRLADGSVTG